MSHCLFVPQFLHLRNGAPTAPISQFAMRTEGSSSPHEPWHTPRNRMTTATAFFSPEVSEGCLLVDRGKREEADYSGYSVPGKSPRQGRTQQAGER